MKRVGGCGGGGAVGGGGAEEHAQTTSRMTAVAKQPAENDYKYGFPGTGWVVGGGGCARVPLGSALAEGRSGQPWPAALCLCIQTLRRGHNEKLRAVPNCRE